MSVMAYRGIKGPDPFTSKTTRNERFAQMSKQEQLIEQKKREIQSKLEEQKKKDADDALKKLQSVPGSAKISLANRCIPNAAQSKNVKKQTWRSNHEHRWKKESSHADSLISQQKSNITNIFSNDGSFLDQFKKISSVKDTKSWKDDSMSCDTVDTVSSNENICLQQTESSDWWNKGEQNTGTSVWENWQTQTARPSSPYSPTRASSPAADYAQHPPPQSVAASAQQTPLVPSVHPPPHIPPPHPQPMVALNTTSLPLGPPSSGLNVSSLLSSVINTAHPVPGITPSHPLPVLPPPHVATVMPTHPGMPPSHPPPVAPPQNVVTTAPPPQILPPPSNQQFLQFPPPSIHTITPLQSANMSIPPPPPIVIRPPMLVSVPPPPQQQQQQAALPVSIVHHMTTAPPPPPPPPLPQQTAPTGVSSAVAAPMGEATSEMARMVAQCGDDIEDIIKVRNPDDQSIWFLHDKSSPAYIQYRILVEKYRSEIKSEQKTEVKMEDNEDMKPIIANDSSNENLFSEVKSEEIKQEPTEDENSINSEGKRSGDEETEIVRRKKKRKSRWAPENEKAEVPPLGIINPPGPVAPAPMLSGVNRNNPALIQYAIQAFGSSNLSEEDWKKAEDHYKINLLYQDMLRKRQELDRLAKSGKFKYEYDSDEETDGGTWEHRLRMAEMEATQLWADELTKKAEGKHHIGDFLPPDELERFMEKYSALKEGREPDLSDYKEFKLKEDNIGFQMLQKLGWSEGQGLGADGSGIVDPVNKATTRPENQGLGLERPDDVARGDDEYDAYRKRMMLAYRFRPNPLNNPRRPYY